MPEATAFGFFYFILALAWLGHPVLFSSGTAAVGLPQWNSWLTRVKSLYRAKIPRPARDDFRRSS